MRLLLFVFMMTGFTKLVGQRPTMESLRLKMSQAQNDSVRAATYYDMAALVKYSDITLARNFADSALDLFTKLKNELGIKNRIYVESTFTHLEGNYPKTIELAKAYESWTKSVGLIEREWYAVSMLATSYRESGDYTKGIEANLRGIEIGKQLNREDENGYFYNDLGDIYSTLKQWEEGNIYFQRALDLAIKTKFKPGVGATLRNLANNFIELKKYEEARSSVVKAIQSDTSIQYNLGVSRSYQLLGKIHEMEGFPDSATSTYHHALNLLKHETSKTDLYTVYQALAKNYLSLNKLNETTRYIKLADEMNVEETDQAIGNLQLKANWHAVNGKYKEAFTHLQQYIQKSQDKLNKDISLQIMGLNVQYETKEKEKEINLLSKENEITGRQLSMTRKWMMGALIASIIFGVLSYWIYRLWNTTKSQNVTIKKSLDEKEILLKEIHHRVKNNLQFVSSLLNLQSRHIEDQKALSALQEGQNRVKSMALIHQNLYQEENLTGIEVKKYLEVLTRNLFQSYNISPDRIKLESEIEALNLDVDTMIPLGLIINELISNALKYAFPGNSEGIIQLKLIETEGELVLQVKDNGVGIPEGQQSQLGKSFGYRLINAFVNQLDARMEVTNDHGALIQLHIKDYKKAA